VSTDEYVDSRTALTLLQRRQRRGTTMGQKESSCGGENFVHGEVNQRVVDVKLKEKLQWSAMPVSLTAQHDI